MATRKGKKGKKRKAHKPADVVTIGEVEFRRIPEGKMLELDFDDPASIRVALGIETEEEARARVELYDIDSEYWSID